MNLRIIGWFELRRDGEITELPLGVQRLLAFLAVHDRPVLRSHVAGELWLDVPEERAAANLRSTLWRINRVGAVVDATPASLRLAADVCVDLQESSRRARALLAAGTRIDRAELDPAPFCADVLPDWYDDWLVIERERFHQLRLAALDRICERLIDAGEFSLALEAAFAAVAAEPLRESSHRAVMKVHLADGNHSEALRHYRLYAQLLRDQLRMNPSPRMTQLLRMPELAVA